VNGTKESSFEVIAAILVKGELAGNLVKEALKLDLIKCKS
jgi:hypothetical protein